MTSQTSTPKATGLAIIFFLLGFPNVYSLMQRRSQQRPTLSVPVVPLMGAGLLVVTIAATCSWLAA